MDVDRLAKRTFPGFECSFGMNRITRNTVNADVPKRFQLVSCSRQITPPNKRNLRRYTASSTNGIVSVAKRRSLQHESRDSGCAQGLQDRRQLSASDCGEQRLQSSGSREPPPSVAGLLTKVLPVSTGAGAGNRLRGRLRLGEES